MLWQNIAASTRVNGPTAPTVARATPPFQPVEAPQAPPAAAPGSQQQLAEAGKPCRPGCDGDCSGGSAPGGGHRDLLPAEAEGSRSVADAPRFPLALTRPRLKNLRLP